MWREYTRETPGKPMLALITAAMALAGTTALARYITTTKTQHSEASRRQAVPGWPFSFELPVSYSSISAFEEFQTALSTDGRRGDLAFHRRDTHRGPALLQIHFRADDKATSTKQVYNKITGLSAEEAESITIGPWDGLMTTQDLEEGVVQWTAAVCPMEGMSLQIVMQTTGGMGRDFQEYRQICRSFAFKDWTIRNRQKDADQ